MMTMIPVRQPIANSAGISKNVNRRTRRLVVCNLTVNDADFILKLLNEPSFLHFIGDKGVRNLADARRYILNGPMASYERNGFGLYLVQLIDSNTRIGICGLLKRDELEDVDIGFAFLPEFWNKGYAFESASAVMAYAKEVLKLKRIVAIVNPDNIASAKLLERLGMHFERMITLSAEQTPTRLFAPCEMQNDEDKTQDVVR